MPTSELSDALNPYASQARRTAAANDYSQPNSSYSYPSLAQQSPLNQVNQPIIQHQHQHHVQHVSELQNAVVQAVQPLPPTVSRQRQGPPPMLAELFRIVTATQTAQEAEFKRRLAWEQEQEAKAIQDKADIQKKMLDLHTEITTLRSKFDTLSTPPQPTNAFIRNTPQLVSPTTLVPQMNGNNLGASPISSVSQSPSFQQPMFIQGSSNSSTSSPARMGYDSRAATVFSVPQPNISQSPSLAEISQSVAARTTLLDLPFTPDPSPHLTSGSPASSGRPSKRQRKKGNPTSSDDDGNSTTSSSSSAPSHPRKRISHHDTKCYSIKHAMRLHVLRMMSIEKDDELPDSHSEGTSLSSSEPVRFVWDKTTKQSVHNARMKTRVLEDLKENKRLYKHVNRQEFANKVLDSTFEQCFTTLRQKYRSQRDTTIAEHQKKREEGKARKVRHLSRRKTKLSNRSEARNKLPKFEHVTFDGALQLECMSSEESDCEEDPITSEPSPILRTHGYAWRSTRLLRFYSTLDDEDRSEAASRPKRGVGRKDRQVGPNKKEFVLPPSGVATWMISRRWYKASLNTHKDLAQVLEKIIDDPDGFNWNQFYDLGDESVDEDEVNARLRRQQQQEQQQRQQEQQRLQLQLQQQQQHQQQQLEQQQLQHQQQVQLAMQQQQWQQMQMQMQMQMQPTQQQHRQHDSHINMNIPMLQQIYDPNAYNINFNI